MTQLSSSTMYYAQAISLIDDLKNDYTEGLYSSSGELAERLSQSISKLNERIGKPLVEYEPFSIGEPPIAMKINKFLNKAQTDINIMQDQFTLLRANTVFIHNYIQTEILKAKRENAQAGNKLKTLQLYSTAHDENVIVFGDYFRNHDFVDTSLVPQDKQASLPAPGNLTLGEDGKVEDLTKTAKVKILASSNGFLGNNQELSDTSDVNPTTGDANYIFKAQINRHARIKDIVDNEPNTWIEYEAYRVSESDRQLAGGYNFVYTNDNTGSLIELVASDESDSNSKLDWSKGPRGNNGDTLRLDIEFDFEEVRTINTIEYTPFGLEGNKNHPVKVAIVQTSENGTDWVAIEPQNLWIGTDANLQTAQAYQNSVNDSAIWIFNDRLVRYVRIKIEQPKSVRSKIGHVYYATPETVSTTTEEVDGELEVIETVVGGERKEGPIPPLSRPDKYYGLNNYVRGKLVQHTEAFNADRWTIGIRDILIEDVKYKKQSVIVSNPFRVSGIIDRVALESNIFVPPSYPTDQLWVRFYVSPDDGLNWYPISRVQDDYFGLPEIIAFNDPLPRAFHETGVAYHTTNNTVDVLRVKIELNRPEGLPSSTPIVFNYSLKVRKR